MRISLFFLFSFLAGTAGKAQQVIHLRSGSVFTIQSGVEITVQGGITMDNGSGLVNNGSIRLKNNGTSNTSNWIDNSTVGALTGTGLVIFNSINGHYFAGSSAFHDVQMNAAGLNLNNNLSVSGSLHLVRGKINTGPSLLLLTDPATVSLPADILNPGYANSWINGNFRRSISANTGTYDFPVGNAAKCNLLQFVNNAITGTKHLTASFGSRPGSDAGLNVVENSAAYTAVNNGGVWYLVPDVAPSGGSYALQLYFNGFTGLIDNRFGILRRPTGSSNAAEWAVPPGSLLEPVNGWGRKVSDGFARRINLSDFSQLGIGMMGHIPCIDCVVACTYSQGFYGSNNGKSCYSNNGSSTTVNTTQLMLNAFGPLNSVVFGSAAQKRFFTLYKSDISNGNIFKMLPGSGNSQALGVDNVLPFDGASYSDQNTWSLVPIPKTGGQKGKINNQLLSQLITLWFNLRNSNTLGDIDLSRDTLITTAQTGCGSNIQSGTPAKFGLPHNVILYLNGGNGYAPTVNGLFQLANDVLGGVNTAMNASDVQNAVATIISALDGCRIMTGNMAYSLPAGPITLKRGVEPTVKTAETLEWTINAFPNPGRSFNVVVNSPNKNEQIMLQVFDSNGRLVESRFNLNAGSAISLGDTWHDGIYLLRVVQGRKHQELKLVKLSN